MMLMWPNLAICQSGSSQLVFFSSQWHIRRWTEPSSLSSSLTLDTLELTIDVSPNHIFIYVYIYSFFPLFAPCFPAGCEKSPPVNVKLISWLGCFLFWSSFMLLLNDGVLVVLRLALHGAQLLVAGLPEKLACWLIAGSVGQEAGPTARCPPPSGSRCATHLTYFLFCFFLPTEKPEREKYWCQRSRVIQIFWWINLFFFFCNSSSGKWVFPPPGLAATGATVAPWGPLCSFHPEPRLKLDLTPSHIFHFRCGII